MSSVSYKSCTLLLYAEKEKYLSKISMFTFTKKKFPGLTVLGAQVRCAQNWYIAVQIDLKYPLVVINIIFIYHFVISDLGVEKRRGNRIR